MNEEVQLKFKPGEPVTLHARVVESGPTFRTVTFLIDVKEFVEDKHPDSEVERRLAIGHIETLLHTALKLSGPVHFDWLNGQTVVVEW